MPEQNATVAIPKDVLSPIIQAHVTNAMNEALGNKQEIMAEAVGQVLFQKVRPSDGRSPGRYDKEQTIPWVQWVMRDALKKATKDAIESEIVKQKDAIRKLIAAQLAKERSPLVKKLTGGLADALTDDTHVSFRISVEGVDVSFRD